MRHQVRFVGDTELPSSVDWIIVNRTTDGLGPFLFVKRSAVNAQTLTAAWRAWQQRDSRRPRRYSLLNTLPAAAKA